MTLPFQIMVVTDEGDDIVDRVERALRVPSELAARVAVQVRIKSWPLEVLRVRARRLRALTQAAGATLLVNGRVDVALEVAADGAHLPADTISVAVARALLEDQKLTGISCHTAHELVQAAEAGASYALLSPVHAVPGKAPPLGVAEFGIMARGAALPVFALGGIELDDVSSLRQAGAAGIAVMRAVLSSADPASALARLCERWHDHSG